jgi:hypothetical protein
MGGEPEEGRFTIPSQHNSAIQLLEEQSELPQNMRMKL